MRTALLTAPAFVFALAALPALQGCERDPLTAAAAHQAGHGNAAIYDASFDEAWRAAHVALKWDDAGTPQDHLDGRFVVTNNPSSAGPSLSDQVGVWFEPMDGQKTRVSVVVITGIDPTAGITGHDEASVQKDIAKALAYVQSGGPIPEKRP
jgi:hypothetical protein